LNDELILLFELCQDRRIPSHFQKKKGKKTKNKATICHEFNRFKAQCIKNTQALESKTVEIEKIKI